MFTQIGNIQTDHLPPDQAAFIENADSDTYSHFIEIVDGDASEPRGLNIETVYTCTALIEGIKAGDIYGYIVVADAFPHIVTRIAAIAEEETKGFWSNEVSFFVEVK